MFGSEDSSAAAHGGGGRTKTEAAFLLVFPGEQAELLWKVGSSSQDTSGSGDSMIKSLFLGQISGAALQLWDDGDPIATV